MHKFPNGKRYIGITSVGAENRWENGTGYNGQKKMADAIEVFGWKNIEHIVIVDGVSQGQSEKLEAFLISELDTIMNGYNVATKARNGRGSYLNSHIVGMATRVKQFFHDQKNANDIYTKVQEIKFDKEECEFWNAADTAVTKKHGKLKDTNEVEVARYWIHMTNLFKLQLMMENGVDISNLKEQTPLDYALKQIGLKGGFSDSFIAWEKAWEKTMERQK